MNLKPLPTNPLLNEFFKLSMTDKGQLVVNEDVTHHHKEKNATSGCCRQEIYYMNGNAFCGYCGGQTDPY